jgi:hypothetical protein
MTKITLKQYKEALAGTFYKVAYVRSMDGIVTRLTEYYTPNLNLTQPCTAIIRSKNAIHSDNVIEGFHAGDLYYKFEYRNITYLMHDYNGLTNVSIKAVR